MVSSQQGWILVGAYLLLRPPLAWNNTQGIGFLLFEKIHLI